MDRGTGTSFTLLSVKLCFWWKDFKENVNLAFGRYYLIEKVLYYINYINSPMKISIAIDQGSMWKHWNRK